MPCTSLTYPPVSAGRKQNLRRRSGAFGVCARERSVAGALADGRTPRRGRIFLHSRRWRAARGVRFAGRRGAGRRWRRRREPTGTASSARDALREESPRHRLQDGPLETRSLARGQKCDTRRQREKRSGEPRHALAGAPRGSARGPHGASRLFRWSRYHARASAPVRSSLPTRPPRDSRDRERTKNDDIGSLFFIESVEPDGR